MHKIRKLFSRTSILAFWMLVIVLFLFSPRFFKLFMKEKSITIFTFPLLLDAEYIADFEVRTGVKMYVHYYETNDALLAKLRSTDEHGYDIIFPSDYVVAQLIKEDKLQKIDSSKLDYLDRLNPQLLNLYYDPQNLYSTPYLWEVYGLGFDTKYFDTRPEASWRLIFDEKIAPQYIGMLNNPREAVSLAALYLFGTNENLSKAQLEEVEKLLINQKKRISVYTDLRGDYLLFSRTCSVIACPAGDVWMAEDPGIDFLLPKEGGFISVDNICIPKTSTNTELVYQFINYLYEPNVIKHHIDKYFFFPAASPVPFAGPGKKVMEQTLGQFEKFRFFKNIASEKDLTDLWIALKAD